MITGSIVALVTPMHPDGSIDWKALEGLLDLHMEAGTGAIGAVGDHRRKRDTERS